MVDGKTEKEAGNRSGTRAERIEQSSSAEC
jgi:hypothetical protein